MVFGTRSRSNTNSHVHTYDKEKEKQREKEEGGREPKRLVKVCRHVRRECLECVGSTLLPRDLMEGADVVEHEALVIDAV